MKCLLAGINAKYIHSNLGIYSIRAYALSHGIESQQLELAEYTINQNKEDVLADIYQRKPDFAAFSCYIWNIDYVKYLAAHLHKLMPELPIWLGGPEVSFQSKELLKELPWLTGILCGEGEVSFLEVLLAYQNDRESGTQERLGRVRGIAFHKGRIWGQRDSIVEEDQTTEEKLICKTEEIIPLNMDSLPFPYEYMADMKELSHRIVYYETSRGCPFGCSYCLSSIEKQVRFRSMELVEKELQFFLDHNVPQVKFVDRTFNLNPMHTMSIWKYIYEHDNGITNFHFELSADLLRQEELEYLKNFRPGLVQFEIGVQSTNQNTMAAIHRNTGFEQLKENVKEVYNGRNIHQHLDLIAGLPFEDYASFRNSFNEVYAMKPDQLQLGFLKVLRGAPIYNQREDFEIVYQDTPPYEVMCTSWLSYENILSLKLVEDMVERYYNSLQFEVSVPYFAERFDTPFDFYYKLGRFFEKKGYRGVHQSRLGNYEILLELWMETFGEEKNLFQQMLLFDLYARENLKNRPAFLEHPVTAEQREWNRKFYQSEDNRKCYLSGYQKYDWKQVARMTHLEHFDYDFCRYAQEGILVEQSSIVLFDYQCRDPLSHQAGRRNLTI